MSTQVHDMLAPTIDNSEIEPLLRNTQGYIMVGHGRNDVWHALIRFRGGADPGAVRSALAAIAKEITPTTHLVEGPYTKRDNPEMVVSALGFTWRGYERMGFADRADKFSLEFRQGFASRSQNVTGRGWETWNREQWDPYNGYHALLIVAAGRRNSGELLLNETRQKIDDILKDLAETTWLKGQLLRNKPVGEKLVGEKLVKKPKEHFGFTDGVSQPVLLSQPVLPSQPGLKAAAKPLPSGWDPRAAPSLVLVHEPIPGGNAEPEFGSYMAFLKIEQHVELFENAARGLQKKLKALSLDEAKALIIGRNQDGSQLIKHEDGTDENDFAASTDASGKQWPFACHTRKMNSREPGQEHHRIVRRGVSYQDGTLRGIYFQCFQANLQEQFEFLFKRWANFRSQPKEGCGVDPIVGFDSNHPQQWPVPPKDGALRNADPEIVSVSISGLTTIRGGEYFYFPSIPFLQSLNKQSSGASGSAGC